MGKVEISRSNAERRARGVYVFDVSQTEGKELPTLTEVQGDVTGYRERLMEFVEAQNIQLEYSDDIAPAKGLSHGGKITLLRGMKPAEEFSTLVHEVAHEMLHRGQRRSITTKIVRETEAEAMVMDGGKRGQIVKVCADPACRIHHGDRPSPQQLQRERDEQRKRMEKEKLALTVRHRILAAILQRVSAPLKKADVAVIARSFVSHLPTREQAMLAKRHKITPNQTTSVEAAFIKAINGCDETALCRLLLEASLMDFASQPAEKGQPVPLTEAAKRYRIDCERIEKAVSGELAAKQKKQMTKTAKAKAAA